MKCLQQHDLPCDNADNDFKARGGFIMFAVVPYDKSEDAFRQLI